MAQASLAMHACSESNKPDTSQITAVQLPSGTAQLDPLVVQQWRLLCIGALQAQGRALTTCNTNHFLRYRLFGSLQAGQTIQPQHRP